jgi:AcrR family transcriptional regulator
MTRRERLRENTREEIKEIARKQMTTMGVALVSLNSIAREMEITTPGLYRYYGSRDELITALIKDAQSALRTALENGIAVYAEDAYSDRLFAAMLMYREWAITHPVDYQLIACEPIPEYQPPLEIRIATGTTIFGIFLSILQAAYEGGLLRGETSDPDFGKELTVTIPFPLHNGTMVAPVVAYQGIVGWYRMHGLIMLEMFHHLDHVVSDPAAYYRHEILRLIRGNGFEPTIP